MVPLAGWLAEWLLADGEQSSCVPLRPSGWCLFESMMLQGCSCCVIPSVVLIAMVCKQTAALIMWVLITRPVQLYLFPRLAL